jgi:hypothetical protein
MTTDVTLYLVHPGSQQYTNQVAGCLSVRDIQFTGQTFDSQRCIDLSVESHPPAQTHHVTHGGKEVPVGFTWLQLEAHIWIQSTPRREIGNIHIDPQGMLPLGDKRFGPTNWLWEVPPEAVEIAESAHSQQANAPFHFQLQISGIVKMHLPSGEFVDLVPLRSSATQLKIELSQWENLMQSLGYKLPPSQAALIGLSATQHPSWSDATARLTDARTHLRAGEDYDALRACLSTLESLVSAPYSAEEWKKRLSSMSDQKATGIAQLLSGVAMYCNKVGHHRSRQERDGSDDLLQMPLDHWEADLVVGATQFVAAYALRLRAAGSLAEENPPS